MNTDRHTIRCIRPDWPAPSAVRACTTTRAGGISQGPWAGLNLGDHVSDRPEAVARNRALLVTQLGLPDAPQWLQQVHGVSVRRPGAASDCADACFEDRPGRVCAVLTADCLPVLFCNSAGTRVAAAHAGWRGLLAGVLEQTVAAFGEAPDRLLAWMGPAIGPSAFEVGGEVRAAFVDADAGAGCHFRAGADGRYLADLYGLARQRLMGAGLQRVSGGGWCTYGQSDQFFSYRRDGITGRMASLIWLESSSE